MVQSVIEKLQKADPEIGNAVAAELQREKRGLELIASENMISEAVMYIRKKNAEIVSRNFTAAEGVWRMPGISMVRSTIPMI